MKHNLLRSPRVVLGLTASFCLLGFVTAASGQVTPAAGASISLMSGSQFGSNLVRGTAAAYDPINNVHLVVAGHNQIKGTFVNAAGAKAGDVHVSSGVAGFGHFPTVVFSPDLTDGAGQPGAFLVTWHANIGNDNYVHGRVVSFKKAGFLVSAAFVIADQPSFWEVGAAAAVAYSPASKLFLVTWQTAPPWRTIRGRIVNVTSAGAVQMAPTAFPISTGHAQYPSIAHNPTANQFAVGFSGYDDTSALNTLAIVNINGTVASRNLFNRATNTYITDMAFNPVTTRFVMTWSQGDGTRVAEFAANGSILGKGAVSTAVGGYDSGSIAYQAVSNTFLVVGHGQVGEVAAAELSSRGNRISAVVAGSNSSPQNGTFYPRVTADQTGLKRWATVFSRDFTSVQTHILNTVSVDGGGNSALPAASGGGTTTPPPTTPPPPTGCTSPKPGANWTCVNGGWLPPTTVTPPPTTPPPTTPPPTGCTTPRPSTGSWNCVNGGWVPAPACASAAPGANWVCVNGGWLPPGHPGITNAPTTPPPTTPTNPPASTGCTSVRPGANWTCVNGGWRPPGMSSEDYGLRTTDGSPWPVVRSHRNHNRPSAQSSDGLLFFCATLPRPKWQHVAEGSGAQFHRLSRQLLVCVGGPLLSC